MNSHSKNLAFATMMAVALAAMTIVGSVSIMPSANADSSLEQTFDKFDKKCDKAEDHKNSFKKEIQAELQAQRHIPFPSIAEC
jgi:invasion protein IalB